MLFHKKQPDTVDLTHGTILINGFMLDSWTTDELFLRIFDDATPSKKQATYVLSNTHTQLNDITFNSVMVQFSPLGFNHQRVAENVTLYVQPCRGNDFIKKVASRLPFVKPDVCTECELIATYSGMRITARIDMATMMASLNIEYMDSASRVDNWIPDGCLNTVTPKSGALVIAGKAYHANIKETTFKTEIMPFLPSFKDLTLEDGTMTYTFRDVAFYDLRADVRFGFLNNKLSLLKVKFMDPEEMLEWAGKHFGKPVQENNEYLVYSIRAAGAREWYIRVYKQQPYMDWLLRATTHS